MLAPKVEDDGNKPLELYKSDNFRAFYRKKFSILHNGMYYDDKVLKLLYSYDWFDLKENNLYRKVSCHPNLTKADKTKVDEIKLKNSMLIYTAFPVYGLAHYFSNKIIKKKNRILARGLVYLTMIAWWVCYVNYRRIKINYDIQKEPTLDKYMTYEMDQNKIKIELLNYNIVI
jgi:hypothetical protein